MRQQVLDRKVATMHQRVLDRKVATMHQRVLEATRIRTRTNDGKHNKDAIIKYDISNTQ